MNESEKDRILRMLSEGALRPSEAAQLLAALAEPKPEPKVKQPEEPAKPAMTEVKLQRADGTFYTIQVPPDLMPMIWAFAKVAIKESARTVATETWEGLKTIAKNKADEAKSVFKQKARTETPADAAAPVVTSTEEARRRILQMVQNGRISAGDASRLLEQIDAMSKEKAA